ncbi:hypothetical protein NC651_015062 [Populus alba x Populus x berolinensis]|nr:hypothetical protein NC651_015055 [Populus alba x Populus x berolinensis]KAJ6912528.1 hypothetical protein NC651_015062 [Populus alba x Populus x berolinensis]
MKQGYNGLKYFCTIVAVCSRTAYSLDGGLSWKVMAGIFSVTAYSHGLGAAAIEVEELVAKRQTSYSILKCVFWSNGELENEHLHNVVKYRAFKSVPLPFDYNVG